MSKASPVVNGENNCGGGEFGDANVNMVAIMDSRSTKNQDFISNQDKCAKMYSCDFDHMYASVNDISCTLNQSKDKETKHLKELLLLHLDLIQQQSEQIVTKDKQIAALKQDYETLKMRFERMERRVTLHKHKGESPDRSESTPQDDVPEDSKVIQNETEASKPPLVLNIKEESETVKDIGEVNIRKRVYKRGSQESESGKRRRLSSGSGTLKSVIKKKRTTSVGSDKMKHSSSISLDLGYSETDKKVKERLKLKTDTVYYTIVGESDGFWSVPDPEDPKLKEEQVQVPRWREKPLAPCYVMEGTENLGDDVFSKRHQRLEVDERRRKRWDIQRIREQNHVEKLKQKLMKQQQANQSSEHPLCSFFPSVDDLEEITIDEGLPVMAFGLEIPYFERCEFSLPWNVHVQDKQKPPAAS